MGSDTKKVEHKIPVINFSEEKMMKPGSDSWILASEKIREGFEEYGCFEVVWDDFRPQHHSSIFDAAKELCDLPIETKMQKSSKRPGARSYIERSEPTPFESFGVDEPDTLQGVEYFTNIMWPQGNSNFCENVHSLSKRLAKLTEMTTRMVAENYGVKIEHFRSITESSYYNFRFLKYRKTSQPNETNGVVLGLGSHTDSSFMTILHQHHEVGEGLQVKTKDDQWIDVKPSLSSFLVLAGDVLMAWTNDRVRPCAHRVIMKEQKVRYCVGFFMFLKGIVSVPEELVDDEHPLLYKPFSHFEYTNFFLTEEARKVDSAIKVFCGI